MRSTATVIHFSLSGSTKLNRVMHKGQQFLFGVNDGFTHRLVGVDWLGFSMSWLEKIANDFIVNLVDTQLFNHTIIIMISDG